MNIPHKAPLIFLQQIGVVQCQGLGQLDRVCRNHPLAASVISYRILIASDRPLNEPGLCDKFKVTFLPGFEGLLDYPARFKTEPVLPPDLNLRYGRNVRPDSGTEFDLFA